MKTRVSLSLALAAAAAATLVVQTTAAQQKPAAPTTAAPQSRPAQTTPAPARRTPAVAASARGGMAITVTDQTGATLSGVHVTVFGATDRSAQTNASGQLNLPGMLPGTYRLRFTGDDVITYEREIRVDRGRVADVDVALNPAPKPPPPPPPPPAPAPAPAPKAVVGPLGQAQSLSLVDLAERQLIGSKDPRRDTLVACSGNTRSTQMQLNQQQAQRVYEDAEALYYVIAGQGTVTIGESRMQQIEAGGYVALPRGAAHTIARRGNRPLIMLAVLSGEPCEQAK
jgi:mannose-6-phosphate isomerase-like protein (cupin superfamily)